MDVEPTYNKMSVQERFFNLPKDASPALKRVVQNLKDLEAKKPFVEQFVKTEGYPLWDRVKFSKNHFHAYRENVENTDTILSLPIVLDSSLFVKDVLKIKLNMTVQYKLFKGEEYLSFGFDTSQARTEPNANDVVSEIMKFEKEIFGSGWFYVTDNKLFDRWLNQPKPENFVLKMAYVATGGGDDGGDQGCVHAEIMIVGGVPWMAPSGIEWDYGCDEGGGGDEGDGDDDGGSSGWGNSPDGGGGGSSTPPPGGNPPNPPNSIPPCQSNRGWVRMLVSDDGLTAKNPCTGTSVPLPTTPEPTPVDNSQMIHNIVVAIQTSSDAMFAASNTPNTDWENHTIEKSQIIVRNKEGAIYERNPKDGDPYSVEFRWHPIGANEFLIGSEHDHPDDYGSTTPQMRSSIDIGDVLKMSQNIDIPSFVSIVNCGNVRYVAVIENPSLFQTFRNRYLGLNEETVVKSQKTLAEANPIASTNWQQAVITALISLLGNSMTNGIGLYVSTNPPDNNNFVKLN